MFKRKPIYIILLIIFTLVLAADIVAYSLTANYSSKMPAMPNGATMQGGFGPSSSGERPQMQQGFNGARPGTSSGRSTSNADSSAKPETSSGTSNSDSSSAKPETSSGASGNFDPTQMQGGFNGAATMRTVFGLASFIGSWWIPIGILCVLVDAFCIFMLIRISKKRRFAAEGTVEKAVAEEEPKERKPQISGYEKRRRKRRRTIKILIIILAIVFIALALIVAYDIYAAQLAKEEAVPVVSAEATSTNIDTDISGTGTLTSADEVEVTIPNEVKISNYSVEDGDTVKEGDVLATVDHTSVMKAIEDIQEAMNVLDAEIEAASSDVIESKIKASVEGRIKAIYAQKGTGVSDTMYEKGALMLISLDGLMAADIKTDAAVATGDSVTVVLADGTKLAGRVDSYTDGIAKVTITDDGTVYGEEVTVSDESGNVLGKGTLYIHSELKITGYSGTVSSIKYDENDKVSAGNTLMTLTDTKYTAEYDLLLEKRSKYEEEMMELFKLYQDGNIYAECAGTVSGVDEETATEYKSTSKISASASKAAYTGTSLTVDKLVYQVNESPVLVLLGNNPSGTDDTTVAGYSNYAAAVSSVAYSSITLKECAASIPITDYSNFSALGITAAMMTAEAKISPSASTPVYMFENGAWVARSLSDISAGDVLILTYATGDTTGDPIWIIIASKSNNQGGNGGSGGGSNYSGKSASSSTSTVETTEPEDIYAISETTVMSVTPSDTMSVTITIDELDILSVKTGQEAAITLDAISGETFTGSVTSIDTTGTNSGGSTKFTAVVSLDRTEKMLAGMNAAVSITLSSTKCAVTIPVAALVESKTGTFVYTSYDEEKNTLGDPVSVTAGISDGTSVEILSGLDSGDKVWYEYDDTVDISSSTVSSSSGGGFNLMRIFGGGRR